MRTWIKAIPEGVELIIVLAVIFAWFVVASSWWVIAPEGETYAMTDTEVWGLLIHEILAGTLALGFLWMRGKRPRDFGCRVTPTLTLIGVGLFVLCYLVYYFVAVLSALLAGDEILSGTEMTSTVTLLPAVLLVLVNPIFEEFFAAGYLITTAQRRWGPATALAGSVVLRMSYHTYQGVPGVLTSLCVGLVFGWAYLRWRQLWPLVIAHALMDALGLLVIGAD